MLEQLKHEVYNANIELVKLGLVIFTWGNVSGIDRASGLIAIKPSGVSYAEMTADDMVVVDLQGNNVQGKLKPSSDTPTHLALYNTMPHIGGVAHTHSPKATAWAQAGLGILPLGTTHADYFYGEIPCTRRMTATEIASDYEHNTGLVIAECAREQVPAALVHSHGPFTWGNDAHEAIYHAKVLEEVAAMALDARLLGGGATMQQELLNKHFLRKHGADSYYGQ